MDTDADPRSGFSRRYFLAATGATGTSLLAGCFGIGDNSGDPDGPGADPDSGDVTTTTMSATEEATTTGMDTTTEGTTLTTTESSQMGAAWQSTELSTVRDAETITVASLEAPVVIQSFAVWCPKCQRQSEAMQDLDDSVTALSLNTDPNESKDKVREHLNAHGFDWRFAVAPTDMTESLVEEFGSTVVNAPSTPIIVVCEDGSTEFFSGSVMSASDIEAAAGDC